MISGHQSSRGAVSFSKFGTGTFAWMPSFRNSQQTSHSLNLPRVEQSCMELNSLMMDVCSRCNYLVRNYFIICKTTTI
jgi:hypothetical protein